MNLTDTDQTCLTCTHSALNVTLVVTCYHPIMGPVLADSQTEPGCAYKIGSNCPEHQTHPLLVAKQRRNP